jgi:hypothetical protein
MGNKTLKGGDLPPPRSGSAVTVGDKTLEEYVDEQEGREFKDRLTPDNVIPYHKNRARYADHKEPTDPARVLTRREINAENWEKIMENQKTVDGVITALLLSGREVSGRELMNNCVRQINGLTKKKYSTRSTYLFHKTDFGKFIQSRRSGKGATYKFVAAALECKPEELMYFIYKDRKEAREQVLEHHVGLKPYLEDPAPKSKDPVKPKTTTPQLSQPPVDNVVEVVREAIGKALGVEVKVSGRVEIVFKLGN